MRRNRSSCERTGKEGCVGWAGRVGRASEVAEGGSSQMKGETGEVALLGAVESAKKLVEAVCVGLGEMVGEAGIASRGTPTRDEQPPTSPS